MQNILSLQRQTKNEKESKKKHEIKSWATAELLKSAGGSGWRSSMLKGSGLEDCVQDAGLKLAVKDKRRSHLEGGLRGNKSTAEGTWTFWSFSDDKKLTYLELYLHAAEPEQTWSAMPSFTLCSINWTAITANFYLVISGKYFMYSSLGICVSSQILKVYSLGFTGCIGVNPW